MLIARFVGLKIMRLNRKELRKIQYDFNCFANRLLQADFQDYTGVLGKFLNYIDSTPIIIDFIHDCGKCDLDISDEVKGVQASYGRMIFSTGDTDKEEIRNVYAVLHYLSDTNNSVYRGVAMGYSYSNGFQDIIRGFNDRFVMVLIRHIERYLTKVGIDMGLDEKITYNVTVENGQAIIATDGSTVNATNQVGVDVGKLAKLISAVQDTTDSLTPEEKEAVAESVEVIDAEISRGKPKKSLLKTALTTLNTIKGAAEFSAAVAALVQFVSQYI